jgi:hypothetical protein
LKINSLESQIDPEEGPSKILPYLMGQSQKFKEPPLNFLTKSYASGLSNGVKMEDTSFTLYREAIIACLIVVGLAVESFVFISGDIKSYNTSLKKMLKSKDLDLSKKQQKAFRKKPDKVRKTLSKKERIINSDIKILEKRSDANAIKPLAYLSKQIKRNDKVSLISYKGTTSSSQAIFSGESKTDLKRLKDLIKTMGLDGLEVKDINDKKFEISFTGY